MYLTVRAVLNDLEYYKVQIEDKEVIKETMWALMEKYKMEVIVYSPIGKILFTTYETKEG